MTDEPISDGTVERMAVVDHLRTEVARLVEERDGWQRLAVHAANGALARDADIARLAQALRDVIFLSQEDACPLDAVRAVAWRALAPTTPEDKR